MKLKTLLTLYLADFFLGFVLWLASIPRGNKWFEVIDGLLVMGFSLIGYHGVRQRMQKNPKKTRKA
ncbi:hypothetical protein KY313_01725 [Candidatus Woesearchaeota archaeon]|jgi:hypothetical protein|nr:hypothetical protein [Candidatus Woesearchaeota archaeon]